MKKSIYILAAWCGLALTAVAGLDQFADEPGYIDLGDLRRFEEGGSVTEVIVKGNLIRMVASVVKSEEPEFAEMLKSLKLVHVHVLGVTDANSSGLNDHIDAVNKQLDDSGWDVMVRMREDEEQNHIYILPEGETGIRGLCVLAFDGSEAVFVNIVGSIDVEMLARLGQQFDIPGLDEIPDHAESAEDG